MNNFLHAARRFAVDVHRSVTWRVLLYTALAGLLMELPHHIGRMDKQDLPATMAQAGLVISLSSAFCIMFAVLVANQAIARGTRPWPTYLLALMAAALLTGWLETAIRDLFDLHTRIDQPGVSDAVRNTQMAYIALNTFLSGFMFVVLYRDYRNSRQAEGLTRAAEWERTLGEQQLLASRLAALRAEVDPSALLAELRPLKQMYTQGAPAADATLDDLIQRLRSKLAPLQ
jgi:hypothetical protein